jgi:hypothetical protein
MRITPSIIGLFIKDNVMDYVDENANHFHMPFFLDILLNFMILNTAT